MPATRRAFLAFAAASPAPAYAQQPQPSAPLLEVIATFTILADLTQAIGGAHIRVSSLIGPDQDAHSYQPRPSDARAVARARVMVANGLGYEGWLERLASAAGFKGVRVLATLGVRPQSASQGAHAADPHAWQDAGNAKIYAGNIRDGLIQADPTNAAHYIAAAQVYLTQLDQLDTEIRAAWAAIPRAARRIVTSHDALGYYARAYGVDFFAPQGVSGESDPTPRQLAALITQIKRDNIRALFVENIGNPRVLQQLARETGARIGPAIYSDALSAPSGPAASYLEMMRHNTRSFIAALR